jgi:hypothetical protein
MFKCIEFIELLSLNVLKELHFILQVLTSSRLFEFEYFSLVF